MKTRIISAVVGLVLLAVVLCLFETAVLDIAVAAISVVAVYEMINAVGLSKNKAFTGFCAVFAAFFSSAYYQTFSSVAGFVEFVFAVLVSVFQMVATAQIKIFTYLYISAIISTGEVISNIHPQSDNDRGATLNILPAKLTINI